MRSVLQKILYLIGTICLLVVSGLLINTFLLSRPIEESSLQIDSFPRSDVYINEKKMGTTPFTQDSLKSGEYSVRLVPVGTTGTFAVWQGKVKLVPGSLSYLSRDLGDSPIRGSGQLLYLEKTLPSAKGELAVISTPSEATVTIAGSDKGKTSLLLKSLEPGDIDIRVSLSGYADQLIHGSIKAGHRLQVFVELAQLPFLPTTPNDETRSTAELLASTSATPERPFVVIKQTPLGFLRVRKDPFITSPEIGQVTIDEKYPLIGEEQGWVQIKRATDSGWVSDQYVEKVK